MDFIERYAKEKNLLQLPIFYLSKLRPIPEKTSISWENVDADCKLECISKYGVPGSFEQDVYTACMRIWVEDGMPKDGIEVSYAQIARKLNLLPPKNWVGKIKKALEKLAQARYEFTKCFVEAQKDGYMRVDTHFSLFSSARLFSDKKGEKKNRRTGKSRLFFPDELMKNLEAKYYQYLDMAWYKALPSGLPRRLYEYLAKRRYHGVKEGLKIGEAIICRWLPIQDRHTTRRRKALQDAADSLIKAGYLESYSFSADKRQCHFVYSKSLPPVEVDFDEVENLIEAEREYRRQEELAEAFDLDNDPTDSPDLDLDGDPLDRVEENEELFDQDDETFKQDQEETPTIQAKAHEQRKTSNQAINPPSQSLKASTGLESRSDQPNFLDAILWLKGIPYMRDSIIKKLTADPEFLSKYPSIRLEYERQTEKIESPAAWIQSAFKTGYIHIKTKQDFEREEFEKREKERARLQNIENETKQAIQKCGGPGKAMYCGHVVEFVFDGGIVFENSAMVWQDIDPSKISAP